MVRSKIHYRALLGLSLVAFGPPGLVSQGPPNAVKPEWSPIQTELNRMKLSSRIRLLTTNAGRQEGRLFFRTVDSLGVRGVEGGETRLALVAVDSMWVRRHRTGLGFLIGTLVGGAGFLVIKSSGYDGGSEYTELDNLFGGLLWAGSALVGTGVGALGSHWKRVHPN